MGRWSTRVSEAITPTMHTQMHVCEHPKHTSSQCHPLSSFKMDSALHCILFSFHPLFKIHVPFYSIFWSPEKSPLEPSILLSIVPKVTPILGPKWPLALGRLLRPSIAWCLRLNTRIQRSFQKWNSPHTREENNDSNYLTCTTEKKRKNPVLQFYAMFSCLSPLVRSTSSRRRSAHCASSDLI